MGLIKAGLGALGGTLADQWKEYFYCEAIPETVLVVKGQKRTGKRSSNTKGTDNIISSGSIIAVADGQCMLIVEQGKVVEVCAEPGEFVFDASTEPSLFAGGLNKDNLTAVFSNIGKRFAFGGEPAKDQRIYYFNTKEIIGNKYGTPNPVPFKVVDEDIGFTINIGLKCFGEYSYRLSNPLLFYANVCGNVEDAYDRSRLDSQLKTELLTALGPAFGKLSRVDYTALPSHTMEIADALNEILSEKWRNRRGIEIVEFGISSVRASEEDEQKITQMQQAAFVGAGNVMAGSMATATQDAMRAAAANQSGAPMAFMGMNMAQGMGANNMSAMSQVMTQQNVYQQHAQKVQAEAAAAAAANSWVCACGTKASGNFCPECGAKKPAPADGAWDCSCGKKGIIGNFCPECGTKKPEAPADTWDCACGKKGITGNFCPECGAKKPEKKTASWDCACGKKGITGNFCPECGARRPGTAPKYKCDKCGWEPEDPTKPPRFCPECGDPFGSEDIV
ncbi:MAG: SPFH domain-containing protein [Eubacterium sp.]|nr:SPFH domain-containing protein [Eubacterium sp.]